MLKVTVHLFGPASDAVGAPQISVALPDGATVATVAAHLAERFSRFAAGAHAVRYALHESFVPMDTVLADGDEVAVIPPVSGGSPGSDIVALVDGPLDVATIRAQLDAVMDSDQGGVCIFEGRTRAEQHAEHGPLVALEYEAYTAMARRKLDELAVQARDRWPIGALALVHRVSRVEIGQTSVIIGVACGHRADAFAACRWLINTLKQEVPIWKREIWASGATTWVDPTGHGESPPERSQRGEA